MKVKVRFTVATNMQGSEVWDVHEFDFDEKLTQEEREKEIEDTLAIWVWENIQSDWKIEKE